MLGDTARRQLDESGYTVLPSFVASSHVERLRRRVEELWALEGEEAGAEFRSEPGTRRLANLVNKGEIFRELIVMPEILSSMEHVLGPRFKLSSLNARSANPRTACGQPLHADAGATADERGYWVCNSVWMLDDFTASNGAIRVVPGSHRWRRLPPPGTVEPQPDEVLLTGSAGTVVVMNAHMWHGATDNRTDLPRRALHAFYTRWDKPQQQYQKAMLSPEVLAALRPEQRRLLAIDDPENDRLSASGSRISGFLK